eukprot:jgi/Ulvmu1/3683/UM017_0099.1
MRDADDRTVYAPSHACVQTKKGTHAFQVLSNPHADHTHTQTSTQIDRTGDLKAAADDCKPLHVCAAAAPSQAAAGGWRALHRHGLRLLIVHIVVVANVAGGVVVAKVLREIAVQQAFLLARAHDLQPEATGDLELI